MAVIFLKRNFKYICSLIQLAIFAILFQKRTFLKTEVKDNYLISIHHNII